MNAADIIRRNRARMANTPDDDLWKSGDAAVALSKDASMVMPEMDIRPEADPSGHDAPLDRQRASGDAEAAQLPPPHVEPQRSFARSGQDDDEMAAALEADRQARNSDRFALAGRQAIAGLTQTPLGQGMPARPSMVPQAQAAAKSRAERAAEVIRAQRQAAGDERQGRLDARQVERDASGDSERAASRSERAAALVRAAKAKEAADAESLRRFEVSHGDSQANAAATRALAGAGLSDRRQARAEDTERADEKQVAELAKASGSDAAMGRKALDEVDAAISAGGGEAPGTGRLTSKLPDFMLSDEGNKVRQNALDALAIMLSVRSGASVSPEELKRTEGVYGINGSSAQFAEGMKRLRRDFESALAAKQAGAGPKVKAKFVEQGGVLAQPMAPQTKTVGDKKLRKVAGGWEEVP